MPVLGPRAPQGPRSRPRPAHPLLGRHSRMRARVRLLPRISRERSPAPAAANGTPCSNPHRSGTPPTEPHSARGFLPRGFSDACRSGSPLPSSRGRHPRTLNRLRRWRRRDECPLRLIDHRKQPVRFRPCHDGTAPISVIGGTAADFPKADKGSGYPTGAAAARRASRVRMRDHSLKGKAS
jgi:hypothetical protein